MTAGLCYMFICFPSVFMLLIPTLAARFILANFQSHTLTFTLSLSHFHTFKLSLSLSYFHFHTFTFILSLSHFRPFRQCWDVSGRCRKGRCACPVTMQINSEGQCILVIFSSSSSCVTALAILCDTCS